MPRTGPGSAAKKTLIWLGVIFAALALLLGGGSMWSNASWTPKLALDLEGGTQMILAPEVQGGDNEITAEQLDQAVEIIRQRVDGSGVSEAEISTQSNRNVVVSLPGVPDAETRELIQASAQMEFRPVLAGGGGQGAAVTDPTPAEQLPTPSAEPTDKSDTNWITPELQTEFETTDCLNPDTIANAEQAPADQPMVACEPGTAGKYILGPVEVPGADISTASFGMAQSSNGVSTGQWAVNIDFNDEGTDAFRGVTERLITFKGDPRNQFAIVLDGQIISAPTVNNVITDGNAQITGTFTQESAKALSEQLKYGALPISFDIQSEQQVSATLGADQLRMGIIAGLIGLILVAVYSLFQYRALGFVTIASLVVAGVLTYLAIAILGWSQNYRLSLAGVAGLIVAIGQTADSFIVYFERIRDELRDGRGLVSAVDTGWKRAKRTVLASKAVNILAAVVLYFVAVGNVRGFAFTLGLTAVADLIVVFMFTHPTMVLLARTKFFGEGHRFSGLDASRLGAVPLYRGAGRMREPGDAPALRGKNKAAAKEAERRMTIAERRLAEKHDSMAGSGRSSEKDGE
ncbi:protein translocase subunit SecD [Arthrobacter sp. zg-Y40]|uniref:protein translocase subunit SecD n=1 Tax=unclassified Arthrobacter TaxID=235627 RepID=UPI001D133399|nr:MULTISPECIES: protein translocase subunit SecD [unclassified Arthrobacter]MCC3274896.1 protein translocase subunit SecD [Arthrobacter sp. zg-Y20]MCC3279133.1 protein translocase subunit SecD [Arthrobacter sp. zg-Y40]MDK1315052.1 protein translocase subunit SecD [Arthrobacter sp. zg.Y20]MDK1327914.1 protein translocase subunit SecD [Arthrobacter sp. zg-Y1143]WIB04899.1 protein translocase subunit SecD [Arthrobacter sp. zg-Y20]